MNLEKLKPNVAVAIGFCCAVPVSIMFMIFLFDRPLFMSLDLWRLLIVGIGLSIPVLMLGYLLVLENDPNPNEEITDQERIQFWAGAGLSGVSIVNILIAANIFIKSPLHEMKEGLVIGFFVFSVLLFIKIAITANQLKNKKVVTPETTPESKKIELQSPSLESPSDSQDDKLPPPPSHTPA